MRSVTIKDVAHRAGVSTATVSHVINNTRYVSDKIRQSVLLAMEELHYEPNAVAKSLRQRSTKTIGLIISDITNSFFTNLARGAEDAANKKGYNIILCNSDENPKKEKTYVDILRQKQVDGIIISPTAYNINLLKKLYDNKFPIVLVDRHFDELDISAVVVNNEEGAYQGTKHLIGLGHHRIGLVAGLSSLSTTKERIEGYRRALIENGLDVDPKLVRYGDSKVNSGYKAFQALMDQPIRPTAIFVSNSSMTIGVLRAIQDEDIRCPEELAIVGFDDFEWSSAFHPYLTTIAQPEYELGKRAAHKLISKLRNNNKGPSRDLLQCKLIVRESCGYYLKSLKEC